MTVFYFGEPGVIAGVPWLNRSFVIFKLCHSFFIGFNDYINSSRVHANDSIIRLKFIWVERHYCSVLKKPRHKKTEPLGCEKWVFNQSFSKLLKRLYIKCIKKAKG